MSTIELLASQARTEVMQILWTSRSPLRLRTIAELTTVSLRPVQVALETLVRHRAVRKIRCRNSFVYSLGTLPTPIKIFFEALENERAARMSLELDIAARSIGPFQEDAFKISQRVGKR